MTNADALGITLLVLSPFLVNALTPQSAQHSDIAQKTAEWHPNAIMRRDGEMTLEIHDTGAINQMDQHKHMLGAHSKHGLGASSSSSSSPPSAKEPLAPSAILMESGFNAHNVQKGMRTLAEIQSSESSSNSAGQTSGLFFDKFRAAMMLEPLSVTPEQKSSGNSPHRPIMATEDEGISLLAPLLVNLSGISWAVLCLSGLAGVLRIIWQMTAHANQQQDVTLFQALPLAVGWVFNGLALIFFNKCMFMASGSGFAFPHPVFLMWFQMLCISAFTNILRFVRPEVMPALTSSMSGFRAYFLTFFPIACLQCVSLVLGNIAYLHISVSQIQMIKNTTSAFVYIFAIIFALEKATAWSSLAIAIVMCGTMLSTGADVQYSLFGFILQMSSTLSEALRLSLTKIMMSTKKDSVKLDPMSACCLSSSSMLLLLTGPMFFIDLPHMTFAAVWNLKFVLCANAMLAMSLNVTAMLYMSRVGATTYALTGVFKDVLLVLALLVLFGHDVGMRAIGFGMAVVGVLLYSRWKTN